MLCINNPYTDAYFNLAVEEYFFKNFREDIFMLWQNEPSVIVGKHQNVNAEVNLDYVQKNGIKIVRRLSGGGTVFHDLGNLNFTFMETNNTVNIEKFEKKIIDLLSEIGLQAKADQRHAININGLKISGSAQCLRKNRAMYHASLLFSSDLERLNASLESRSTDTKTQRIYVKSVKSPVTNISAHIDKSIKITDLKKMIMNRFIGENPDNKLYRFDEIDIITIRESAINKYSTYDWNFNANTRSLIAV